MTNRLGTQFTVITVTAVTIIDSGLQTPFFCDGRMTADDNKVTAAANLLSHKNRPLRWRDVGFSALYDKSDSNDSKFCRHST